MHRVLLTPIFKFPIWKSWIRFSSRSPRPMESKAVFTCWKRIAPSLVSWAPGVSAEEFDAEAFFKFADGFADSRLADVEFFGGAGDVAAAGYFVEDFVL